jgi:hypothetical protein
MRGETKVMAHSDEPLGRVILVPSERIPGKKMRLV